MLSPNTFISTSRGLIPISDVVVGDDLKTVGGYTRVTAKINHPPEELSVLGTANGLGIQCRGSAVAYGYQDVPVAKLEAGYMLHLSTDVSLLRRNLRPSFPATYHYLTTEYNLENLYNLLGYCLTTKVYAQHSLTLTNDYAIAEFRSLVGDLTGFACEESTDNKGGVSFVFDNIHYLSGFLERIKLQTNPAYCVEHFVFNADMKHKAAFLSSIFACGVVRHQMLVLKFPTPLVRWCIQLLLTEFGINSISNLFELLIPHQFVNRLVTEIGIPCGPLKYAKGDPAAVLPKSDKVYLIEEGDLSASIALKTEGNLPFVANSILMNP